MLAFTGPTHAGKSTTAFGLGQLDGWRLVADDTLAFSSSGDSPARRIQLHPLKNEIRLRPATADYFAAGIQASEPIEWAASNLQLRAILRARRQSGILRPPEFTRLRAAEGLPLLLQQAYALSFKIPTYNQKLMRDYAELAASVPVFRLSYKRTFTAVDELFNALETHTAADVGLSLVGTVRHNRPDFRGRPTMTQLFDAVRACRG